MVSRFGGLRPRLAIAISAVSLAVLGAAFLALRESTGSDLRDRIDRELGEQYAEFQDAVLSTAVHDGGEFERRSERFIASQSYHPKSRIFLVQVDGGRTVTNENTLLEREAEGESEGEDGADHELAESGLLHAPPGLATVSTEEAGNVRVLSEPIDGIGGELGTFRVADPLETVEEAQSGLNDAFLLVGAGAIVASLLAAALIATFVTRPVRRMAAVALTVDSGDLDHRIGPLRRHDEVGSLAESFDHMLDRLQSAFQRQEDFVSDASHELRTPLTVLRGQIELLEREPDPDVRERTIETVVRELDHMSRLVDDMLTLAAAEGGDLVRRRPVELSDFLEDLRRDLPLMGDRDYRLEGIHEGVIEADPERLSQVFRNLARNAAGVTEPGDRITVTATPRDGWLEFAVSDAGPGIPLVDLDRVFDRFHRAESDGGRRGGTGLGLAIARAIVEAHGGRIWVEVPPAGGTTIRFDLPDYHGYRT